MLWATGFDRDHTWIDAPVFDARGEVIHARGVTASPARIAEHAVGAPAQARAEASHDRPRWASVPTR